MVVSDKLPPSQCILEIAHFVLKQHVEAPSMWQFFLFSTSLVKDKELKTAIKDLVRGSGRSYPPSEEVEVQAASGKASAAPEQHFSSGQEKLIQSKHTRKEDVLPLLPLT
ncbi:hypothetical protein LguiB_020383 [Lonicera macranthoides]